MLAPLPGDLPIYENLEDCVSSINKLKKIEQGNALFVLGRPGQGSQNITRRYERWFYLQKIHEGVLKGRKVGKD